jgi:hypothetical protein
MTVTREAAEHLTAIALACRPHGARRWDGPGVLAAIGKVKHLSLADVAMATVRAACDRHLETPGAIANTQAPCWKERPAEPTTKRNPRPAEACVTCGREYGSTCCDKPARRREGHGPPDWVRQMATTARRDEEQP